MIRETLDVKKMTQTKIVALAAEPIQTLAVGACVSPLIGSRGGGECAICQAKVQAAAIEELQPEEQPQQPRQQPAARALEQERQPEEGEWGWDDDEAELQFGADDAGSPATSPPAKAQGQSHQRSEGRGERRDAASARGVEPGSRSAGRRAGGGGAAAAGPSIQVIPPFLVHTLRPYLARFFPENSRLLRVSPPRRDGSNELQAGTQGQETAARGPRAENSALRSTPQMLTKGSTGRP